MKIYPIISSCYALENVRNDLVQFTHNYADELSTELKSLILRKCLPDSNSFTQFIVDCSTDTDVITLTQYLGDQVLYHAFAITRTWAYVLHRERLKLLGRWRNSENIRKP